MPGIRTRDCVTEKEQLRIKKLFEEGLSDEIISIRLNRSRRTIKAYRLKLGLLHPNGKGSN